jgi:hypothetical protein
MTTTEAFAALMPEPFGYVPFPGEFYPPDELDAEVKDDPFTTRVYPMPRCARCSTPPQSAPQRCAMHSATTCLSNGERATRPTRTSKASLMAHSTVPLQSERETRG